MPVSPIIAVSWLAVSGAVVAVVLLGFTLLRRPRHKRRQAETAMHIFDGDAIEPWRSVAVDEWTGDDRDAAIRFYNSAGRQVRIGAIRLNGVPAFDRTTAQKVAGSLTPDEADRWTDLTWLASKIKREARSSTPGRRAPDPPTQPEKLTKPGAAKHVDTSALAGALALADDHADSEAPTEGPLDFDSIVSGEAPLTEATCHTDIAGENAEASYGGDASATTSADITPDDGATESPARSETAEARGDDSIDALIPETTGPDAVNGDDPLPSVPAWILEARAALDNGDETADTPVDEHAEPDAGADDPNSIDGELSWPDPLEVPTASAQEAPSDLTPADRDTDADETAADKTATSDAGALDAETSQDDRTGSASESAPATDRVLDTESAREAEIEPDIDLTKLESVSVARSRSDAASRSGVVSHTGPASRSGQAQRSESAVTTVADTADAADTDFSSEDPGTHSTETSGRGAPKRSSSFSPASPVGRSEVAAVVAPVDASDAGDETANQCAADAVLQAEIKRFERKAKKARRKANDARDLAVKRARQNRSKAARAAAVLSREQGQRAKKFAKRAEKLRRSASRD